MDIKLTGALPQPLRDLGLKPGDKFQNVEPAEGHRKGTVRIWFMIDDAPNTAIVYIENYKQVNSKHLSIFSDKLKNLKKKHNADPKTCNHEWKPGGWGRLPHLRCAKCGIREDMIKFNT